MGLKIAITMRTIDDSQLTEVCDALCTDWPPFLRSMFGSVMVFPLMNDKEMALRCLEYVSPDLFIFSGGESLKENPERDDTEFALAEKVLKQNIPIFAVCRGFQMINHYLGGMVTGDIHERSGAMHAGVFHEVFLTDDRFKAYAGKEVLSVNSYHNQGVVAEELAPSLKAFAVTGDDTVEGYFHDTLNLIGVQWHPERDNLLPLFHKYLLVEMLK